MSGRGGWQWRNIMKRPPHSVRETMDVVSAQEEEDSEDLGSDNSKFADEVEVQATAELLGNLRQMVDAPAFSDVVFVCNDQNPVQASRMLLAARSEVLQSMLMNGMAESNLSKIELPEISSPVMLSVLEFLYTGALVDYPPTSWRMACEVVIASRFFLLPTLEAMTRKFMRAQISFVGMDLPKAASLLTEAVELKAVSGDGDVNLRELVTILSSNWSDPIYVKNLCEEALHFLLATTKANNGDDYKLSFEEYLRFRQVIRWWVHRSEGGSARAEEILNIFAPDEESALLLCKNLDHLQRVNSPLEDAEEILSVFAPDEKKALLPGRNLDDLAKGESLLDDEKILSKNSNSFQLDKGSRDSVIKLLSNIDFRWIHPILLTKVVEPLKVVPSAEILGTFRFHALRRPAIFRTLECGWELGESYIALEKGYVVHKIGNKIGLAVMKEAMGRSYGVYQWRFFVQICPEEFCELGFLYYAAGVGAEKSKFNDEKLSDLRLSDLYRARVLNFQKTCASVNWEGAGGRTDWKVLVHAGHAPYTMMAFFNYDASERTCSLSINGQDFGVIWKDLPNAVYYPAVSLGNSNKGRVRIELVSGFDIF